MKVKDAARRLLMIKAITFDLDNTLIAFTNMKMQQIQVALDILKVIKLRGFDDKSCRIRDN